MFDFFVWQIPQVFSDSLTSTIINQLWNDDLSRMKSFATPWYQWRWTSPKPQRFSRVTRSRTTSGDGLWHPQLGMVYEIDTTTSTIIDLVGGFKHVLFSIIYGIILPVDSYFSRWLKLPTIIAINLNEHPQFMITSTSPVIMIGW